MADRLRPLWDFDDLDTSEQRFRAQLDREESDPGRAEVLTQLARVEALRGEFEACERLLDQAEPLAGGNAGANVRLELERGRMYRSSGDPEAAYPLFQSAFGRAVEARELYLAGDAAHMCAIAVADLTLQEEWTRRGLDLGEREPDAAYWAGPLLNNLGWAYQQAGEHERALDAFQRALAARERDPENRLAIEIARYAVGVALRSLGRADEAARQLEPAVAWAEAEGKPDAWFHEELAEDYAAAGRADDARTQAELALELIDPDAEPDRATRLRELAGG
jgi:tetratricopeptide (TPR) repeat protein